MAKDLGDIFEPSARREDFAKKGEFKGAKFEDRVRETLRRELPNDCYFFLQGVIVSEPRTGAAIRRDDRIYEIDFVVAGRNGIFFVEAKNAAEVSGAINGDWRYSYGSRTKNELRRVQKLLSKFRSVVEEFLAKDTAGEHAGLKRFFKNRDGHVEISAHPIFVFPDKAKINLTAEHDKTAGNLSPLKVVHLARLAETIEDYKAVRVMSSSDARVILEKIIVPAHVENTQNVGSYEIVPNTPCYRKIAANNLEYTVCQLRHRERRAKLAAGKCYDLLQLDAHKTRERFVAQIERHADVISQISHRNIRNFYDFFRDLPEHKFWVVEEWVDGKSLDKLDDGERKNLDAASLMRQVAEGLRELHENHFILRELNESDIIVENKTNRVVLTNFETTKILSENDKGAPTVFATGDARLAHLAPELRTNMHAADRRADIYAWASIFFHLATGKVYAENEHELLTALGTAAALPQKIQDLIARCLAENPRKRPSDFGEVLTEFY